jgi:hypothetical protein
MAGELTLVLIGTHHLDAQARLALQKWVQDGMSEVAAEGGRELVVHTPKGVRTPAAPAGSLTISVTLKDDEEPKNPCGKILGECGTAEISIARHRALAICGPDPKTRKRRIISSNELLGHALANTVVHEIGHMIGGTTGAFADNGSSANFMNSGGVPKDKRTADTQLAFFAGRLSWTADQKFILARNIKARRLAFEDEFTVK